MSDISRRIGTIFAIVVGLVVGGVAALSADLVVPRDPGSSPVAEGIPTPRISSAPQPPERSTAILAWAPGGLSKAAANRIGDLAGVSEVTRVVTGIEQLVAVHDPEGVPVEQVAPGWFLPLDTAVVDPRSYADFVTPSERKVVATLRAGEILLSETSANLRRAEVGSSLTLASGRGFVVGGIIGDRSAGGYEAIVARPHSFGRAYAFVLAAVNEPSMQKRIALVAKRSVAPGTAVRVRSLDETPYLRYGDAVLPPMIIKRTFGEFALRPTAAGFDVDPGWRTKNIVSEDVPILGPVVCHRVLVPQLRAALSEIEAQGMRDAIDPADYGGCFSPRFIGGASGGRLSHHSWGIAVDIDVSENAFGIKADQDARVVEVFERHGFTWGGRWLIPDGMHFEWVRFP